MSLRKQWFGTKRPAVRIRPARRKNSGSPSWVTRCFYIQTGWADSNRSAVPSEREGEAQGCAEKRVGGSEGRDRRSSPVDRIRPARHKNSGSPYWVARCFYIRTGWTDSNRASASRSDEKVPGMAPSANEAGWSAVARMATRGSRIRRARHNLGRYWFFSRCSTT